MEEISFCSKSDLEKLQKFIHEKWKRNHILAINKELLDFQHKTKNGYNFVISKNNDDEITSVLGFIPLSQYDGDLISVTDVWLAIWKVDETIAKPGIGFSLLKWLEKQIKPQSIGSIGINTEVKKIYDILGYNTGILKQYYILNPFIQEYKIAKLTTEQRITFKHNTTIVVKEIEVDQAKSLNFKNFPLKSLKYIENRYFKHPIYKYILLGIYKRDILKAIFVVRKIDVNQSSCLRIVDIQGDYTEIGYVKDSMSPILQKYNSEYIDCLNHGISEQTFFDWGFNLRDSQTIIPNYFEPFLRKNIDIIFAYKSKKNNYIIFKGDSDQDRPNILQ